MRLYSRLRAIDKVLKNSLAGLSSDSAVDVRIVEVGPRDGLQNESKLLPSDVKIDFVNRLSKTGLKSIEVTSFVSATRVPQMADNAAVFRGIEKSPDIAYSVLTPNMRGFVDAAQAGAKEIAVITAASDSFSHANVNCTAMEALKKYEPVMRAAKEKGIQVRGYVSTVLGCPYEGRVSTSKVVQMASSLLELGCYEISLGDTIGIGTPAAMTSLLHQISQTIPVQKLAVHCHDTYGQALPNILAALDFGVTVVDASVSGLGGCPYALGASGNAATEDVLYMLHGMGVKTDVSLPKLIEVGRFICAQLGRPTESKVTRAYARMISTTPYE